MAIEKLKLEVANLITDFWRNTIIRKINELIDSANTPVSTGPKVYVAKLSQSGENNPTATIIENTLGGDVTFIRTGVGTYRISSTGLFTADKTFIHIPGPFKDQYGNFAEVWAAVNVVSANIIDFQTSEGGAASDEYLYNTFIKIEVYS
jgi:hypothetical protein